MICLFEGRQGLAVPAFSGFQTIKVKVYLMKIVYRIVGIEEN